MVFSRYSVVLLRRVTSNVNNLELLQAGATTTMQKYRAEFISELAWHKTRQNYSTLVTNEIREKTITENVPSLGEGKAPNPLSLVSHSIPHDLEFEFENSDRLLDVVEERPGVLDPCVDDLSHIGPSFPVTFNFAAYANKSPMIQKLAELGVDFSKIERRKGLAQYLMPLDFDRDMKYHIRFLNDCGVPADKLGEYLTKNPLIFREDLDDLHTRIRYLSAHKFSPDMIARIVLKNPFWVMFSTKRIDTRLGFFQKEFGLSGHQVRTLATKQPRLVTYRMEHIKENTFAVKEEMGFDKSEMKMILLGKPRIWMKNRRCIVDTFDYAHNEMKLPHKIIAHQPAILTCRLHRLKERHMFLATQKRVQYDPEKPLYVSPEALISGTDAEFCANVAKTPVETFNMFLKTL